MGDEERPVSLASLLASADPLRTYYGRLPIGQRVLFIIDADMSMLNYITPVARATNALIHGRGHALGQVGVIMASAAEGPQLVWAESRDSGLDGTRSLVDMPLSPGRSDLAKAIGRAVNLQASHVIVVHAKLLDADEMDMLAENVQQTGAVVDFFPLGAAHAQDPELQRISESTGGKVFSLTDADLRLWSDRGGQAVQAEEEAGSR